MKHSIAAALAAGVASLLQFMPAQAATFADFSASSSDPNIQWTQSADFLSGTLATTGSGVSADTDFSFLGGALAGLTDLPALFTLTASGPASDPVVSAGGFLIEPNLAGTFTFTYEGATPLTVGTHTYVTGANLLTGTFSGSSLSGPEGGSAASFLDSVLSGGVISYSSAFTGFSTTGDKAFSLSMTSVLPSYDAFAGSSLNNFTGVSTGSFAADLSSGGGAGGVPEPATWTLMLLGVGMIGGGLRLARRKDGIAPTSA